jgi:hypothetical protein
MANQKYLHNFFLFLLAHVPGTVLTVTTITNRFPNFICFEVSMPPPAQRKIKKARKVHEKENQENPVTMLSQNANVALMLEDLAFECKLPALVDYLLSQSVLRCYYCLIRREARTAAKTIKRNKYNCDTQ